MNKPAKTVRDPVEKLTPDDKQDKPDKKIKRSYIKYAINKMKQIIDRCFEPEYNSGDGDVDE